MPDDLSFVLGMHVRFLPNFYITNLLPQNNWTGTIVEVRRSSMGQPAKYLVHLQITTFKGKIETSTCLKLTWSGPSVQKRESYMWSCRKDRTHISTPMQKGFTSRFNVSNLR